MLEGGSSTCRHAMVPELRFDADVHIIEGPGAHDDRLRRARLLWRDASLEAPFMASAGAASRCRRTLAFARAAGAGWRNPQLLRL